MLCHFWCHLRQSFCPSSFSLTAVILCLISIIEGRSVFAFVRARTRIRSPTHTRLHAYVRAYMHKLARVHAFVHARTCVSARVHARFYTGMCTQICGHPSQSKSNSKPTINSLKYFPILSYLGHLLTTIDASTQFCVIKGGCSSSFDGHEFNGHLRF